MSDWIINVEGISKSYNLLHKSNQNDMLIKAFAGGLKGLFSKTSRTREKFWALDNVSFTVKQGDRVGIIGRNGSGKSTLLKILSRVVKPTRGRIEYKGSMASLLEVGTGFHGDLTGRENIFLNGTILGLSRAEISSRFDEIVEFSEISQFLDTPVKRYSSGMYVRLAFAVAAHLNPDILVLDEVLAVGDSGFQKKCIDKMTSLSLNEGRTILFVSHSMPTLRAMCNVGVHLEKGRIVQTGRVEDIIQDYSRKIQKEQVSEVSVQVHVQEQGWLPGSDAVIEVRWPSGQFKEGWECDVACYTLDGAKVFALQSQLLPGHDSKDPAAKGIAFHVRNVGFSPQDLRLDVGIRERAEEPYVLVLENCATLSPAVTGLPTHLRRDVVVVPPAQCSTLYD